MKNAKLHLCTGIVNDFNRDDIFNRIVRVGARGHKLVLVLPLVQGGGVCTEEGA